MSTEYETPKVNKVTIVMTDGHAKEISLELLPPEMAENIVKTLSAAEKHLAFRQR